MSFLRTNYLHKRKYESILKYEIMKNKFDWIWKWKSNFGSRKLSEKYRIGKTSVLIILKDEEKIQKEFKIFESKHFILNVNE